MLDPLIVCVIVVGIYSQVLEVRHIACLPCLENLRLVYNPVTIVVDYRTKILELFGDRASEVSVFSSEMEISRVSVLRMQRVAWMGA